MIEDAEPLDLAASADGRSIFVRGREIHLAPGMFAPDMISTIQPKTGQENPTLPASAKDRKKKPEVSGSEKGGDEVMTKDELKAQYPTLTAEIEVDAVTAHVDAVNAAVQEERQRIKEIDQLAGLYSNELVSDAKYGDNACTAQELAYRAAQQAAKKGSQFIAGLESDTTGSKVNSVPVAQAAPSECDGAMDELDFKQVKAMVHKLLGNEGEA